jgi:rare lipoprotein A
MLKNNSRIATRTIAIRSMLIAAAATLFMAGTVTESSAKSPRRHGYHHHHSHQHHHHHHKHRRHHWRNANASIAPIHVATSGRSFSGVASFYGNESGSRTASGQRFNQNLMTAAHRSLPFGTRLRVTHGGRSVVVTINDRGPFIRGRVLDLSTGAARAIGLTSSGVGHVVAEVM